MSKNEQEFDANVSVKKHCEKCNRATSHHNGKCYDCVHRELTERHEKRRKEAEKRAYEDAYQEFRKTISVRTGNRHIDLELLARKLFDLERQIERVQSDNVLVG